MAGCHTGGLRNHVRVGRHLPPGAFKGVGFSRMSNEERIGSTRRASLPGWLVFLPQYRSQRKPHRREQAAWEARFRAGPTRMIVIHAAGNAPVSPKRVTPSHVLAAGIVSYVLFPAVGRVEIPAILGAFGLFAISSIYLELVRISARVLPCARSRHGGRCVPGRCRHRQAGSERRRKCCPRL